MILTLMVKTLLFLMAGVFNSLMDKLQFHYDTSIFPQKEEKLLGKGERFWNPKYTAENKNRFKNKYLRLLFRTALIWTTDPWHFFQFMMLNCFTLAVLPASSHPFWTFIIVRAAFSAGFTLFFHYLLIKNRSHGNRL